MMHDMEHDNEMMILLYEFEQNNMSLFATIMSSLSNKVIHMISKYIHSQYTSIGTLVHLLI